jgi:hypothetical protein
MYNIMTHGNNMYWSGLELGRKATGNPHLAIKIIKCIGLDWASGGDLPETAPRHRKKGK